MYTKTISIPNFETAKSFSDTVSKYMDVKIKLLSDDLIVDAHSILGVMSIDKSKPVLLQAEGKLDDDFIKDIEAFAI